MNQEVAYSMQTQNAFPVTIPSPTRGETVIPFELSNKHIFLQVRMNNSAPLWFILDTGAATSMIDLDQAKSLGLTLRGQIQASGAGANSPTGAFISGATLSVPGADGYTQPLMIAMPLNSLALYEGRPLSGVLGYEFFSRHAVEIDYAARRLTLYDAQKFDYKGEGEIIPLTFKNNHPHVRAEIEQEGRAPVAGDFVIDIGSRGTLVLTRTFVEAHGLLRYAPRTIQAPVGGVGVGGESRALVGRLKKFRLGRVVIENVPVSFSQDEGGVFATSQFFEGNVGGEILSRFKVIFDYARQRMIVERGAHTADAYETDMSGALLVAEGADFKTFRVRRIVVGTPAAESGLREGDVITAVNGQTAARLTLEGLREMFKSDGREFELAVERGADRMRIKLKTRRLI